MKLNQKHMVPALAASILLFMEIPLAGAHEGPLWDNACPKPVPLNCPQSEEKEVVVTDCSFVAPSASIDVPDRSYCLAQDSEGQRYRLPYRSLSTAARHWIVKRWEVKGALDTDGCFRFGCYLESGWQD